MCRGDRTQTTGPVGDHALHPGSLASASNLSSGWIMLDYTRPTGLVVKLASNVEKFVKLHEFEVRLVHASHLAQDHPCIGRRSRDRRYRVDLDRAGVALA